MYKTVREFREQDTKPARFVSASLTMGVGAFATAHQEAFNLHGDEINVQCKKLFSQKNKCPSRPEETANADGTNDFTGNP